MAAECSIDVEDVFGPVVKGCGSNWDFTLLFEETILFIGPLCVALLCGIHRLWQLRNRPNVVAGGWLLGAKLVPWCSVIISQALLLALIVQLDAPTTRATLAAVSLGMVGAILLAAVSYLDHYRSVRPSSILNVYLLFALPMNVVRVRTMWMISSNEAPSIAFLVYTVLGASTLVCEMPEKRSLLLVNTTTEETGGIFQQAFVFWIIPLFRLGLRKRLVFGDLIAIPGCLSDDRFATTPGSESATFLYQLLRAHWKEVLEPVLPRACYVALVLAQPFLVERATEWISQPIWANPYKNGGGLIAAYFLVYMGLATTFLLYQQKVAHMVTVMRAGLVSQIQQGSLELDMAATSKSSATTLMSTDVERVQMGMRKLHEVWGYLLQAVIGLWLLETKLGVSMYIVLGLVLACVGMGYVFSKYANRGQHEWLSATQERIAKTIRVLSSIRGTKMIGCGDKVHDMLIAAREKEVQRSTTFRSYSLVPNTIPFISLALSPAFGIGVHAILAQSQSGLLLDASTAFSALTLLSIVSDGLTQGLNAIFNLVTVAACLQRIHAFLQQNARKESRVLAQRYSQDSLQRKIAIVEEKSTDGSSSSNGSFDRAVSDQAIVLKDVSASWTSEAGKDVLRNVTASMPRGRLTVITGPTACGKSTLLKAVLGEVQHVSGWVSVAELPIAYCDQSPWLANTSIKENIVGQGSHDEAHYREALRVTALEHDLAELSHGDASICGSDGLSLSGGQKARIALARAVYAAPPTVVLDDCFSGLDPTTEQEVLHSLFGVDGLFSRRSTTVILATSSTRHLRWADHAIILSRDGTVESSGSYQAVAKSAESITTAESSPDKEAKEVTKAKPKSAPASISPSDWQVYKYFFGAIGWSRTVVFLLLMANFVTGITYPQIYLNRWTSKSAEEQRATLGTLLGIFFGLGIMGYLGFTAAATLFILKIQARMSLVFHRRLLDACLAAPMSFFTSTDSGLILNRFSQDLQVIDREISFGCVGVVVAVFQLIAQCIVIIVGSNWSGIAIPALLIAIAVIQRIYLKTSQQLRLLDLEAKAPLFTHFLESLSGLVTIRAFGWTKEYQDRGNVAMKNSQVPFYLLYAAQNTLNLVLDLLNAALAMVVISVAVGTRSSGSGGLGLALFTVVGLGQSMKSVVVTWTSFEVSLGAVARIRDFATTTESENRDTDSSPPENWPGKGAISFNNITVAYPTSEVPVLSDLGLHIEPGWKVAICGRTGSGKSTLIGSLLRLVEPRSGTISIDGIDLAGLNQNEVRSRFAVIPQEPFTLHATLRENFLIRSSCSDETMIAVLQKHNLWSLFEARQGLDTLLTDEILSHGQRQLLSFAMATPQQASVVILDEPTSSMDADVEASIQKALWQDFPNATVLCVTHRLETVLDFDRVAVLEGGRIVEFGRPRELVGMGEASMFRRMVRQQAQHGGDADE